MNAKQEALELRRLWGAFRISRVLLTANNFRVFDHLRSPKTAEELAQILNTDNRATEILLDALVGLKILKKSGRLIKGLKAKYRNASLANHFLISGEPSYQGDILMHADTLWHNWSGLDEVMKTGRPFQAAHDHEAFIMGMHNLASLRVKEVLKHIDLRGAKNALDLGSGPGTYAIGMAKKGIAVTLFDRPETLAIAQKLIKQAKVKGVSFIEGDFLFDDIGKGYDLVFISQILHALSAEQNKFLLAKSMQSLNSGGTAVIQEFYIDRSRTSPPQSALFSINMLVNTEAGRCYAPSEIKQWLSEAGFSSVKHKIFDDHVLVTGRKI